MRRDLLYLGAVIVNAALMIQFGYAVLLAAIGPAWLLRSGSARPICTVPLALIALAVIVPVLLGLLGADCPIQGMDYLDQCNGRAKAAMLFLFGGVLALQVSVVAGVCALLIRAGRRCVVRR